MRLFKNLNPRILKSIIMWSTLGKQTTQAKEVYWQCVPSSLISFANTVIDFVPCWACMNLKAAMDRFTCFAQCALIFVMAVSSVSSSMRPAFLVNLRKSFPPQRSVSLSFFFLSFTPIQSASRLVCSYHSSNFSRYFEGSSPRLHGLPAVARAA